MNGNRIADKGITVLT